VFSELLSGVHIGEMNFNIGYAGSQQGVPQGNAGVSEGSRIDDNEGYLLLVGLVYPGQQLMFSITLTKLDLVAKLFGHLLQVLTDLIKGQMSVVFGFADAKQIQIGAI
jgi:hypothetical protein